MILLDWGISNPLQIRQTSIKKSFHYLITFKTTFTMHLASQNLLKIEKESIEKSIKNQSSNQCIFLSDFSSIFGRFWVSQKWATNLGFGHFGVHGRRWKPT